MKRIVFSFDDGLLDFYENVFPILKKYNIKATLNVITGFSDKSVDIDYKCCSIKQLKELAEYGIEIANHSNDHICPEPLESYDVAQRKLIEWFPDKTIVGVVTPFTQAVPDGFFEWCKKNRIKYVRLGDIDYRYTFQRRLVKMGLISHFRIYCNNNTHHYRKHGIKIIHSIQVYSNTDVDYLKKIITVSGFSPVITIMFHSIVHNEDEFGSVPYPDGAWTASKFEELVKWTIDSGYSICCQRDTM